MAKKAEIVKKDVLLITTNIDLKTNDITLNYQQFKECSVTDKNHRLNINRWNYYCLNTDSYYCCSDYCFIKDLKYLNEAIKEYQLKIEENLIREKERIKDYISKMKSNISKIELQIKSLDKLNKS